RMWNSTPASSGGKAWSTMASGGAWAASRLQKQITVAISRRIAVKFILVRLILRWARRKRTEYVPSRVAHCGRLLSRLFARLLVGLHDECGRSGAGRAFFQAENEQRRRGRAIRTNLES